MKMESGYVSREVSPSRQSTVPGPINIERSVETGTTSNQSPDFSEVVTKPCDPPVITFHHKRIDHSEAESRLKASNTKGSYLTRECRSILSYIINCSTVKHIVIPHSHSYKARKLLKIEDLCLRITFISIPTFRYATSNDEVTVGRNKCYKCCRSTAPYRAAVACYLNFLSFLFVKIQK